MKKTVFLILVYKNTFSNMNKIMNSVLSKPHANSKHHISAFKYSKNIFHYMYLTIFTSFIFFTSWIKFEQVYIN